MNAHKRIVSLLIAMFAISSGCSAVVVSDQIAWHSVRHSDFRTTSGTAALTSTRGDGGETPPEVNRYDLTTEIDPENHSLTGSLVVNFTAKTDLGSVVLQLFPELNVSDIRDERGVHLPWERGALDIEANFSQPVSANRTKTLFIDFFGVIGASNVQLYNYIGPEGVYLANYLVQENPVNGSWFPWMGLAPMRMNVSLPTGYVAITQGKLESEVHTATMSLYSWNLDRPWLELSYILAANRYEAFDIGSPGTNSTLYLIGDDAGKADSLTSTIRGILSFYSSEFGRMPCDDLRVAETVGNMPQAQGPFCLVFVHRDILSGDFEYAKFTLAHEIAHQWWGSGIRGLGPGYRFLSEGFAQYSSYLYEDNRTGDQNLIRVANANAVALARGEFGEERPIANTSFEGEAAVMTCYAKGAMALHMLRYYVGDEAFFSVLRDFVSTYSLSNATLQDFEHLATRVSGENLTRFFGQWVHSIDTLDFEVVGVSSERTSEGYVNRVSIRRNGRAIMPLDVALRYPDGSSELFAKAWDGESESVVLTLQSKKEASGVELDPQYWLLDIDRGNNLWPVRSESYVVLILAVVSAFVVLAVLIYLGLRRRRARLGPSEAGRR